MFIATDNHLFSFGNEEGVGDGDGCRARIKTRDQLMSFRGISTSSSLLVRYAFCHVISLNVAWFWFCWIQTLSSHSCHCRAMRCIGKEVGSGPGRNGCRPGETAPIRCIKQLGRISPASGGRQLPGGDSRSTSFPVDDVHQARIT